MTSNRMIKGFIYLLLVCLIVGCSSSADSELARYIYEVKLRKSAPIEPIPELLPLETYIYPEHPERRNPFKLKAVKTQQVDMLAPNTARPKEPLEMFPLDALKFVGIWKQGGVTWGLVSQPGGVVTRVKVGTYMGQNFGRIISITETSLKLEERVQASGKWDSKITTFNLNTSE